MYFYPILTPPSVPPHSYSPQKGTQTQCSCSSAVFSRKNGRSTCLAFQGLKGGRKIPRGESRERGEHMVVCLI